MVENPRIDKIFQDRTNLKESTILAYRNALFAFTSETGITPERLLEMPLSDIEDSLEGFIRRTKNRYAAKWLNVIYSSVVKWLTINKKIRNSHEMRDIEFERTKRKVSAMSENPIETNMLKAMFDQANPETQTDLGFYALCGVRPSLLVNLRVKNIFPRHRDIVNGKIALRKPTFVLVPSGYAGNKGNVDFLVIIPTRIAEKLETQLNNRGLVTEESKLSTCNLARTLFKRIKVVYKKVGFSGRPYMLRKYADTLLKAVGDYDLREFLMGHKGSVSQIYEVTGISREKEQEYLRSYAPVESRINSEIFGITTSKDLEKARAIAEFAQTMGVRADMLQQWFENLQKPHELGGSTIEQFNRNIQEAIKEAQQEQLKDMIDKAISERLPKALEQKKEDQ